MKAKILVLLVSIVLFAVNASAYGYYYGGAPEYPVYQSSEYWNNYVYHETYTSSGRYYSYYGPSYYSNYNYYGNYGNYGNYNSYRNYGYGSPNYFPGYNQHYYYYPSTVYYHAPYYSNYDYDVQYYSPGFSLSVAW